jgi:hypothetical protein
MNTTYFEQMCRDASEKLGLEDTHALGRGMSVSFGDVVFEATQVDAEDSFLLLADLGAIAPSDRVSVYKSLVADQAAAREQPRVRFRFHPMHEAAVLCVGAALGEKTDGAWLAMLLKSMTAQVANWRKSPPARKIDLRYGTT